MSPHIHSNLTQWLTLKNVSIIRDFKWLVKEMSFTCRKEALMSIFGDEDAADQFQVEGLGLNEG